MSIESVIASNHLTLCCPFPLPAIFPSIGHPVSWLFTSGGQSIGASASVLPINIQGLGFTGLISLLSKSLKSLLEHHSSKASIIWCSSFFMALLSHPYTTTGKTRVLTRWTFVCKVTSLAFYYARFVIVLLPRSYSFLPRSKHLLISVA